VLVLDVTVNVALPTIGRDFKVSATAVDSISIAFLVSLAVFIPASARLGDRLAGKRVMLTAIAVFAAASALSRAGLQPGRAGRSTTSRPAASSPALGSYQVPRASMFVEKALTPEKTAGA
jgi:MFS family permease